MYITRQYRGKWSIYYAEVKMTVRVSESGKKSTEKCMRIRKYKMGRKLGRRMRRLNLVKQFRMIIERCGVWEAWW